MAVTTEKRIHQHCSKCGHDTFVSYDGTTYGCENCNPNYQSGGARVVSTGDLNPRYEADNVLRRARNRGGSGKGDESLIGRLLGPQRGELDQDRIDALERARALADEQDRAERAGRSPGIY